MVNLSKSFLSYIFENLVALVSLLLAFIFRYNFDLPNYDFKDIIFLSSIVLICFTTFIYFINLDKISWRAISYNDIKKLFIFYLICPLFTSFLIFLLIKNFVFPKSVFLLYPIIFFSISHLGKFSYQFLRFKFNNNSQVKNFKQCVVIGLNKNNTTLIQSLANINDIKLLGIFDNDYQNFGRYYSGIEVKGSIKDLKIFLKNNPIDTFIIDTAIISNLDSNLIFNYASKYSIDLLEVPSLKNIIEKKISINKIRKINLDDLLGRSSVEFDFEEFNNSVKNKVIAISGAGGSIGSEISLQITKLKCKELILIDNSELNLYKIVQLISKRNINFFYYLCDIKNTEDLEIIFKKHKPDHFYHAAAYKHVPLLETSFNAFQAYKNNILGTKNLIDLAEQHKVDKFVLVSSDKAVNPTNLMGATKRYAELLCLNKSVSSSTNFMIVRFGNVLGSSGSVIPLFMEQINQNREITITDKNIERFFMSIVEASQLVISSSKIGKSGDIFILDMGKSIKILKLAKDLIKYLGFGLNEIKIKFIGLRAGEKLYEELNYNYEKLSNTDINKIKVARINNSKLKNLLDKLPIDHKGVNQENIKKFLKKSLNEYRLY